MWVERPSLDVNAQLREFADASFERPATSGDPPERSAPDDGGARDDREEAMPRGRPAPPLRPALDLRARGLTEHPRGSRRRLQLERRGEPYANAVMGLELDVQGRLPRAVLEPRDRQERGPFYRASVLLIRSTAWRSGNSDLRRSRKSPRPHSRRRGSRNAGDLQRVLRAHVGVIAPDTLVIAEEYGEWTDARRGLGASPR
jgi:hypothetical protein